MTDCDEIYCPVCGKVLQAMNQDDIDEGIANGRVFVHDDIVHTDDDLEALAAGIN